MKNIHDKTEILLDQLCSLDFRTQNDVDRARTRIRRALREQDRDTRHACAEAVLQCNDDLSGECIWKDGAHNACMNVKAI